jgi:signal transduction histidine kinase
MGDPVRPQPAAARARAAAAPSTAQTTPNDDSVVRDLQTLLTHAVSRLREVTQSRTVVAWALRPDAEPYVAAASFEGEPPRRPSLEDFETVARVEGAQRLDTSEALIRVARNHGLAAAAVVSGAERSALAVLLLGDDEPRPRGMAALTRAAQRLEVPLAAAMAAGRMRELDGEVRRLDRLAALGTLTAEIAHEVRNPLVSVKTFLQLLPERGGDPEFNDEFLRLVTDELRRMERLLDVVIEHAQPSVQTPNPGGTSIGDAVEAAIGLLRHRCDKRGSQLDWRADSDLPRPAIEGDALRQVILNLLLNAIEVTPEGGTVRVRAVALGKLVELRVADEGPGIAPQAREEIFAMFFSTRADRAGGLGLAITRRIVDDCGGSIEVRDVPSGGAEFVVRIPVV